MAITGNAEFDLSSFRGVGYDKGRPRMVQAAWFIAQNVVFSKWWCPVSVRVALLRIFGAEVGERVVIRHRVRVHWPWKLRIGDNSWIGEGAWILNLEFVEIGANSVLSQEALLCTGSHDRHSPSFEFDNGPIRVAESSWIGARAVVLRGVTIGDRAVVGATALVTGNVAADGVVVAPRGQ